MKKIYYQLRNLVICISFLTIVSCSNETADQSFCITADSDQIEGEQDGFRYELWNQYSQGTACMTLGSRALFSGKWKDVENYLARRGLSYDQTQEYQEIGRFYSQFDCDYNPSDSSGMSYLSIYGWTVEPLAEYYIIENWSRWIPSMAEEAVFKDSIVINGSVYDIFESIRINQPSIVGDTIFPQYFSIRREKRNAGKINISDHFEKWEELGMEMGKLHEVSFVVEGFQNYGTFEFKELDIYTTE